MFIVVFRRLNCLLNYNMKIETKYIVTLEPKEVESIILEYLDKKQSLAFDKVYFDVERVYDGDARDYYYELTRVRCVLDQ